MKKDDAVAILRGVANHLISGGEISYSDKVMLALDTAIKALKEVKNQNQELNNSNDLISRAAAIDAFRPYAEYESNRSNVDWVRRIEMVLNDLPSVQPETCKGCKHLGKWENEVEYGYPSPCTRCKRRVEDRYER